jgi:hypothetical protein
VSQFTKQIGSMQNTLPSPREGTPQSATADANHCGHAMQVTRATTVTKSAPNAELWRQLFASLTGDTSVDAVVIREFCDLHGVTPAQVLAEMHAHRRTTHQEE